MAWLESHQTLAEHPKRKRLTRLLGASKAATIGHLHMLWWWAMDYAQDGDLSKFDDGDLADAGGWEGDPDLFVKALIQSGFITEGRAIHDWSDYAGRLIEQRTANAARMREARAKKKPGAHVQNTCGERAAHVQGLHDMTVPNQTVPDMTQPEGGRASAHEPLSPSEVVLEARLADATDGPSPGSAAPLPRSAPRPVYDEVQVARLKAAVPADQGRLNPAAVPDQIRHQLQQLVHFGDIQPETLSQFRTLSLDETVDWCAVAIKRAVAEGKEPIERFKYAARVIGKALESGVDLTTSPEPAAVPKVRPLHRAGGARPVSNAQSTWAILDAAAAKAGGGG